MRTAYLIKNAHVVDPGNKIDTQADILIQGEKIASVGRNLTVPDDETVIDAKGKIVIPGLVDSHVHISSCIQGYFMLAKAGVTTCLDMSGKPDEMAKGLETAGTGLTAGFLYPLIPGKTVSGTSVERAELKDVARKARHSGAFGIKILGGHYPLLPETTRRAIEVAHELGIYCAVHAGTTENGSNIKGLAELLELAHGLPVHIAHINSYCRGQITANPVEEALKALEMLQTAENVKSESYLSLINGTSLALVDSVPASAVTKTCLTRGGYACTRQGMEAAIRDGWAQVHGIVGDECVLLNPDESLAFWKEQKSSIRGSFRVNSPAAAITLATAKDDNGHFIVNAISTDGGSIPRNTTLKQGLALVRFGALTMAELITKAAWAPAKMLNLPHKGHLGVGADADLVILDKAEALPGLVIARGTVVYKDGNLLRQKSCMPFPTKGQRS